MEDATEKPTQPDEIIAADESAPEPAADETVAADEPALEPVADDVYNALK